MVPQVTVSRADMFLHHQQLVHSKGGPEHCQSPGWPHFGQPFYHVQIVRALAVLVPKIHVTIKANRWGLRSALRATWVHEWWSKCPQQEGHWSIVLWGFIEYLVGEASRSAQCVSRRGTRRRGNMKVAKAIKGMNLGLLDYSKGST